MTQLVELQQALPRFKQAGIKLYAVSYDEQDALNEFAHHHGITYPLLADKGSKVIEQFGIRNTFVTKDQIPYYGIPFPGTYLVGEDGRVMEKFFHRNLAQRESADSVVDSALGEILLGEEEPQATGGNDDIKITVSCHGGGGQLKTGSMRNIIVRFQLAPGIHIYDNPVPNGMVATNISLKAPPGLNIGEVKAPKTHPLVLPNMDAELQVWDGQVDFVIPVYADDRLTSIVEQSTSDIIEIEADIRYQACNKQSCFIPQRETIQLRIPLASHIGPALDGKLDGTNTTTMNSQKYLDRMIRRGLLQSPLRGLKYLVGLATSLWKDTSQEQDSTKEKETSSYQIPRV